MPRRPARVKRRSSARSPVASPRSRSFTCEAPGRFLRSSVGTESIELLRDIADGHNDILAEAAGITAGARYAWPSTHIGHELIAAGRMILAGGGRGLPLDYDELERWTRVGFERGTRSRNG